MSPGDACAEAVRRIIPYYPNFQLGLVCMDKDGNYGAAAHGWVFTYAVAAPDTNGQAIAYDSSRWVGQDRAYAIAQLLLAAT